MRGVAARHPLAGAAALLCLAAATLLPASDGGAFRLLKNSVTKEELRWEDGQNDLTRNTCSISSDDRLDLYFDTIERWNEIGGIRNVFEAKYQDAASICVVRKGNARNQVAVVDRDQIDGNAGLSVKLYFGRFLTEDDVFIASDMGTLGPDVPGIFGRSGGGNAAGRNTLVHEFGHSIGLDHDDSKHAIMQSFVIFSAQDGFEEFSSPYPDDVAGVRNHYAGGESEMNLIPSWQVLYDDLPAAYQDRYDIIIGPPPGQSFCTAQRILSYNRSGVIVNEDDGDCDAGPPIWTVFNPDPDTCSDAATMDACEDFGPGGPAATTGTEGVTVDDGQGFPNRVLEVCPGDTIRVPFTVSQRRSVFDPVAHRTVLLSGPLDAGPGDLTNVFEDSVVGIDHGTDGDLVTRVAEVRLQEDVDCWVAGEEQAVFVSVDHCREVDEERENGDTGEEDNRIRTDVRFRLKAAADCGSPPSDGSCSEFFIEDCDLPGDGEPPGYAACEDMGINAGECAGGPCAPVDRINENDALDWESAFFADGDHTFDEYCENFTEAGEMVCNDDDGFGVCERCGVDTLLGCSCEQEETCESLGEGLACFGEEFGLGFCWDLFEGPPIFHCAQGTCETLGDRFGNDPYYCSQEINEIPQATCIPWNCPRPTALTCAEQNLICSEDPVQVDDCALQCLGDEDCSPAFGWPAGYACNFETDRCEHP